jgi:hypothetical protein
VTIIVLCSVVAVVILIVLITVNTRSVSSSSKRRKEAGDRILDAAMPNEKKKEEQADHSRKAASGSDLGRELAASSGVPTGAEAVSPIAVADTSATAAAPKGTELNTKTAAIRPAAAAISTAPNKKTITLRMPDQDYREALQQFMTPRKSDDIHEMKDKAYRRALIAFKEKSRNE